MQKYQILGRSGEGTFSEVLKAQNKETKQLVAIKCFKKRFESKIDAYDIREIHGIRKIGLHENIIGLVEVLFDKHSGRLAVVFEYVEMNIYELIRDRKQFLPEATIVNYMYQFLKGLEHTHYCGLFHRDIKPENVLVTNSGVVKIADFGSCRGRNANQPFTEYISTRWYRSPECLLTDGYYTYKMDIWAAGCVFFEMATLVPLFAGSSEVDQVNRIHSVLGSPPDKLLEELKEKGSHMSDVEFPFRQGTGLQKLAPNLSEMALDLLSKMLQYDENDRCTAKEALRHPYFKEMREADRAKRKAQKKGTKDGKPTAERGPTPSTLPTLSSAGNTLTSGLPRVRGTSIDQTPSPNSVPKRSSLPKLA